MFKIVAKQETSLKWDWHLQASEQPPNHVVRCVMSKDPTTGELIGKTLTVDRAVLAPDGKHAQVFFDPPANIKLQGVVTVWKSGYLFIEHWPDLVAKLKPQVQALSASVTANPWGPESLTWKGWLDTYSKVVKGGVPQVVTAPTVSTVSQSATGSPRRFKPQEFRSNSIAAKFIAHFEGLELHQYYCSAGVSTIGLGTTRWTDGRPIPEGATVTKEQAIELFKRDAKEFMVEIQRMVDVPLTARQIASILSFCYNCGWQGFEESSLLKSINAGAPFSEIRNNFRKWSKANGETLPGLLRRRNAEAMLWEGRDDWSSASYD